MNGVARDFWAEVYALNATAAEPKEERRLRPARSKAKKELVRRPARRGLR